MMNMVIMLSHRCDWQRTIKQEIIRLHYVSLYIYFVPLSASAKKAIVRPIRPKLLEHSVSPRLFWLPSNTRGVYHYFLYYFIFFMETVSVSEVSGPYDMEAIEKKKITIPAY